MLFIRMKEPSSTANEEGENEAEEEPTEGNQNEAFLFILSKTAGATPVITLPFEL